MGRGGKDASLEVFETQLKKLLHIIDKLPKTDRDKAVNILKISANHYSKLESNLSVSQSLQDTEVSSLAATSYCAALETEQQYFAAATTYPTAYPTAVPATSANSRLESETILAELGGLEVERGEGGVGPATLEDDWDQHVGGDVYTMCSTASPTCALCFKTFTQQDFMRHYQVNLRLASCLLASYFS